MKWKKYFNTALVAAALLALTGSAGLEAQQLVPGLESRYTRFFDGDSLQVDYLYAERETAPFLVFLPDRFGVTAPVHQLMQSFADAGYHTATLHLDSDFSDSSGMYDALAARIVEAVVDIRNDPRGNDKTCLIAFDIGAVAGMVAESRVPLFSACAVFYPAERKAFLDALQKSDVPVEVNLGRKSTRFPESEMLELKRRFMSKSNPILFRYYDAGGFFFNSASPDFDDEATQRGVQETALFVSKYAR